MKPENVRKWSFYFFSLAVNISANKPHNKTALDICIEGRALHFFIIGPLHEF
jgi:hypothetical protein